MSQQTFLKVPFVWEEPKPLVEMPPRLTFEPVKAKHGKQLVSVVARVMALSLVGLRQKLCPDEAQTSFIGSKHVTMKGQPINKSKRHSCSKG